jgi:hypothetical protein
MRYFCEYPCANVLKQISLIPPLLAGQAITEKVFELIGVLCVLVSLCEKNPCLPAGRCEICGYMLGNS